MERWLEIIYTGVNFILVKLQLPLKLPEFNLSIDTSRKTDVIFRYYIILSIGIITIYVLEQLISLCYCGLKKKFSLCNRNNNHPHLSKKIKKNNKRIKNWILTVFYFTLFFIIPCVIYFLHDRMLTKTNPKSAQTTSIIINPTANPMINRRLII